MRKREIIARIGPLALLLALFVCHRGNAEEGVSSIIAQINQDIGAGAYADTRAVYARQTLRAAQGTKVELTARVCAANGAVTAGLAKLCRDDQSAGKTGTVAIDISVLDFSRTRTQSAQRLEGERLVPATALVYNCKDETPCVTSASGKSYSGFILYCDDVAPCQQLMGHMGALAWSFVAPAARPENDPTEKARQDATARLKRGDDAALIADINNIAGRVHHEAAYSYKGRTGLLTIDVVQRLTYNRGSAQLKIDTESTIRNPSETGGINENTVRRVLTLSLGPASIKTNMYNGIKGGDAPEEEYRIIVIACPNDTQCVHQAGASSKQGQLTVQPYIKSAGVHCNPETCDKVGRNLEELVTMLRAFVAAPGSAPPAKTPVKR